MCVCVCVCVDRSDNGASRRFKRSTSSCVPSHRVKGEAFVGSFSFPDSSQIEGFDQSKQSREQTHNFAAKAAYPGGNETKFGKNLSQSVVRIAIFRDEPPFPENLCPNSAIRCAKNANSLYRPVGFRVDDLATKNVRTTKPHQL